MVSSLLLLSYCIEAIIFLDMVSKSPPPSNYMQTISMDMVSKSPSPSNYTQTIFMDMVSKSPSPSNCTNHFPGHGQ